MPSKKKEEFEVSGHTNKIVIFGLEVASMHVELVKNGVEMTLGASAQKEITYHEIVFAKPFAIKLVRAMASVMGLEVVPIGTQATLNKLRRAMPKSAKER